MRRETEAHNTIEVDGEPQAKGVPRTTSLWRSNAGLDIYRGAAMGYRPVAHDRAVYFVKPGFWVVSDDLTGDTAAHEYRQLWHFPGDPVTVNPTTKVATVGFDTVPGAAPVAGVRLIPVATAGAAVTPRVHKNGAVRVGERVLTDVDYLSYDWSSTGPTGLDTVVVPGQAGAALGDGEAHRHARGESLRGDGDGDRPAGRDRTLLPVARGDSLVEGVRGRHDQRRDRVPRARFGRRAYQVRADQGRR